jgi:WD40 repeat protein/archaellum biogenesis ATPase FlaH
MVSHKLDKSSIVAILQPEGYERSGEKISDGTGFFISDCLIVTCAHVINPGSKIEVDVLSKLNFYVKLSTGEVLTAKLEIEYLRAADKEDFALLRLVDQPKQSHLSLRLSPFQDISAHEFETYGFPSGHSTNGLFGTGKVTGIISQDNSLIQLSSPQIVPGFSGGPILDCNTGFVIGMTIEKVTPDTQEISSSGKKKDSDLIVFGLQEVAFALSSFKICEILQGCSDINLSIICPYQGLNAFTEDSAVYFFGRDELIKELIQKLERSPQFLLVSGTSGSGKSSAIIARLLPMLKDRDRSIIIDDASQWTQPLIVMLRFSGEASLESQFFSLVSNQIGIQVNSSSSMSWLLLKQYRNTQVFGRLILFIDQFEEIFALHSPDDAESFLDNLNQLLTANRLITLIIASRIEFEAKLEASPLNPRLSQSSTYQIRGTLGSNLNVEDIIIKPAELVGLRVETGLVDRILEDLKKTKNILPLLEFALTRLWEIDVSSEGKSSIMTLETYKKNQAIDKILKLRAEEVFKYEFPSYSTKRESFEKNSGLRDAEDQKLLLSIFGRLIQFGSQSEDGGLPDTRKRRKRSELEALNPRVSALLDQMTGCGLLVSDAKTSIGNSGNDDESIEIIHDILINEWLSKIKYPTSTDSWLKNQRKFRFWQQRLEENITEWTANDQSDEYLLASANLAKAEEYCVEFREEFSSIEQTYVEASIKRKKDLQQQAKRKDEELLKEKAIRETEQQRNAMLSKARKISLILLGISIPAAILASVFAINRSQEAILSQRASNADQVSSDALRKFPSGQLDALQTAIDSAKELQELTRKTPKLEDYPTITPITALARILDDIQELSRFNAKQGEIRGAVFLPDGKRFITAGEGTEENNSLKLWFLLGDKKEAQTLNGHRGGIVTEGVRGIAIAGEQDPLIASAGGDHTVRLWNQAGESIGVLKPSGSQAETGFTSIAVSPDGQRVVAGQSGGWIHLWERSGKLLKSWEAHSGSVTGIAFDGQKIASSSDDGSVQLWNSTGTKSGELKAPNVKKFMHVSFSRDGKFLATASDDGLGRIWTAEGKEVRRLKGHDGPVTVANFSPDGKIISTAGDDGTVRIWNVETGKELKIFRGHRGVVWSASFSQDGRRLISAGRDGEVRLWNLEPKNEKTVEMSGFKDDVNTIAFSPDGKTIVGAGNEGVMRQWDRDGKERKVWKKAIWQGKNVQDIVWDKDGKQILAGGLINIARVWKVDENNGEDDPFIKLKGSEGGEEAHKGDILSVAISPDTGELIATGSADKTIRLWTGAIRNKWSRCDG